LSANLPDCRAYELVTPAETAGANITAPIFASSADGFNNWLTVPRGVGAGEALTFDSSPTLAGFEGSGVTDGYRSARNAGPHPKEGWNTELVSPSYVQSGEVAPSALNGSPDQLYSFWLVTPIENFEETLSKGVYLRTPTGFEAVGQGILGEDLEATSQFVSTGGAHVLFSSKEHLEGKAAPKGTMAIYDREAGKASAEVISVTPAGSPFDASEGATYLGATEDGSAVAFEVGGVLYLHRAGTTTEIATSPNTFAGISEDGSRVFYADAASQPAGLFVCDTKVGPCAGSGAHAPEQIAPNSTFVNVSADGSHVYFTSTGALTPPSEENENHEHAEAGSRNLYAWDGVGTSFIAILDPQDLTSFGGLIRTNLGAWTEAIVAGSESGFADSPARSTPSGAVFVFQSHAQLSAYENEGFSEIYRYVPTAPSGQRLICLSCDPGGFPPSGDAVLERFGVTATGVNRKTVISNVTEKGEAVFFSSPDRLLPEDANNTSDVYEWRAKGSGTCTRSGGCLALISSGQGDSPSFLYAMSADGHDVFIRTKEKLVGMDVSGSYSIYDAREGGGIPEPAPEAECQGDACQGQGSESPRLPVPATMGSGGGNVEPAAPTPCTKGKHRVKGHCVPKPKKHKHRKHRRHRRVKRNRGGNQ
jgi:hypothetical protein